MIEQLPFNISENFYIKGEQLHKLSDIVKRMVNFGTYFLYETSDGYLLHTSGEEKAWWIIDREGFVISASPSITKEVIGSVYFEDLPFPPSLSELKFSGCCSHTIKYLSENNNA